MARYLVTLEQMTHGDMFVEVPDGEDPAEYIEALIDEEGAADTVTFEAWAPVRVMDFEPA